MAKTAEKKISIKTKDDAAKVLEEVRQLSNDIDALMAEHGITELTEKRDKLKSAVTKWAVSKNVEAIEISGAYGKVITAKNQSLVLADDGDIEHLGIARDGELKTLKEIIEEKFGSVKEKGPARRLWNRVTRRVVDMEGLNEAVGDGLLTVDEIAPSYFQTWKAPYLRIFPKS
jgi:hypothetical protein